MHRDSGRRRAVRVVLMAVLLALAFTTVAFGLTHAEALADWTWGAGQGLPY
jgi:hypothetical protein